MSRPPTLATTMWQALTRPLVGVHHESVSAEPAATRIATYRCDSLGRRYRKIVTHNGDRERTEYFYYDSQWRLLEVRNANDAATRQFVWGTQYIDELVCMDVDTDGDGDCLDEHEGTPKYGFERYRYFQDANWNVTAIWAEHAGHVVERYEYDPYGTCRIFAGWDSAAGCETGNVIADSLVPGGNPIRYAGYHFDNETGLYQVRYRMYSPGLGRWLQRDPVEYADAASLYLYVNGDPVLRSDPLGLLDWNYCWFFWSRLWNQPKQINVVKAFAECADKIRKPQDFRKCLAKFLATEVITDLHGLICQLMACTMEHAEGGYTPCQTSLRTKGEDRKLRCQACCNRTKEWDNCMLQLNTGASAAWHVECQTECCKGNIPSPW